MAKTQLTWYGQSAYKILTPGGKTLLIDPWITNPKNPNGEQDLQDLTRVDLIFLTHGHSDHTGNMVEIARTTGAKLVCDLDLATAAVAVLGFPAEHAQVDTTGLIGGNISLLNGEVIATQTHAVHGSSISKGDGSPPAYAGEATGMVIAIKNGPIIYHTGDTDVFSDMSLIGRLNKIDVMLACIGDHFTMGPERAALAVKLVQPKVVIPNHYATFPVLTGTPEAFRAALKEEDCKAELRVMEVGQTIDL